ncbi:hypothetical protein [Deinococcus sonorensis]|uniref:OstA family protein n=2 Tax=Deinococcus sonorensis TaxID=309891 RepID=A0AAU7U9N9_9DEIO
MRMRRVLALLTLTSLTLLPAQAATFGGFQITARGEQRMDLGTGRTELPQGGTAVDAASGLTLDAAQISYLSGQNLTASHVTLHTREGGTLSADTLSYDQRSGLIEASGHLTYSDREIRQLSAAQVRLDLKAGILTALGGVRAQTPTLSASRVVARQGGAQVLLSGPYLLSFKGGRYQNPRADGLLLISGSKAVKPDAQALAPFRPYLK